MFKAVGLEWQGAHENMRMGVSVARIVNRPVARLVLEQPAEIEHAGALLVEIEFPGKRELVALGHEFGAAGIRARCLVPETRAVPGGRVLGKYEARVGDALGVGVALEVARGLVAQGLARLIGGGCDSRRAARRGDAACVEVVDGHGVCLLSGK